jgi:hypothetical protein
VTKTPPERRRSRARNPGGRGSVSKSMYARIRYPTQFQDGYVMVSTTFAQHVVMVQWLLFCEVPFKMRPMSAALLL